MSTVTKTFQRSTLSESDREHLVTELQGTLVDLIDLALTAKQAHWNLVGQEFKQVHVFLDEITAEVQAIVDEVAERISALGIAPDGRAETVSRSTRLEMFPQGFVPVGEVVSLMADRVQQVASHARESEKIVGEIDSISEDTYIKMIGVLEKQLWMLQAIES